MEGQEFSDGDHSYSLISRKKFEWIPPSWRIGLLILLVLLTVFILYFVFRNKHKEVVVKPIPVVVSVSTTRDVPIYLSALGGVTPTYTITVRTQINGQLLNVFYKEGQMVKKGDLLAQIDPRPYEALLTQYEGDLKRDKALLANARIDLKRYQVLWKQNSTSQQILATQLSLVEQYEGAVKIDEGLIAGTKVNLIWCRITSPTDGRVGLRLVDPGNVVQTNDTNGIAVVNTLNPITVIFTLAEDNIPQLVPQVYTNNNFLVNAYDRQHNKLLAKGKLLAIDNQIDPTTGTVRLRAEFDNKDNKLFANQFVNIKILVKTLPKAVLVPTAAVQHSTTEGNFVYLVNKDNTVSVKLVKIGPVSDDDTVITQGVIPGQSLVIEGADKLRDGSKVVVESISNPSSKTKTVMKVNSIYSVA